MMWPCGAVEDTLSYVDVYISSQFESVDTCQSLVTVGTLVAHVLASFNAERNKTAAQ